MSVFKNPFFLIPCMLFWANQYLEKVLGIFLPWVHAYLDDLLAMPVVLGISLQIFRWIHPLKSRFTFTGTQVLVGFLYISFLFELFLPLYATQYRADAWDVACYGLGSWVFYRFINVSSPAHSAS